MTAPAMTAAQNASHDTSAGYEVGYGKPPRRTQFRKGRSGNPGGRPRRPPVERANALLLQEAYRIVAIKEDGRMVPMTVLQAILRSQVELAINGHFRAQREILQAVKHLEFEKSLRARYGTDDGETDGETDDDETDEVGESGEEDEGGQAHATGESDATDGDEDDDEETDEAGESGEEDDSREADATAESDEEGEAGESNETGSGGAGAVVTAASGPAPLPENGAAPPVSLPAPPVRQAAPVAPPRVPSALRRPPSPPSRGRRTPAPAGSRAGRRHAVTRKRATGSGPAAREPDRIPRGNSGPAETGKIPC